MHMSFKEFAKEAFKNARTDLQLYLETESSRVKAWFLYQWNRPVAAKYAVAFGVLCILLTIGFFGGIK